MKICFGVKEGFFLYDVADIKLRPVGVEGNNDKEDKHKQYFIEIVLHTVSDMMVRVKSKFPYPKDTLEYVLRLIIEQMYKCDHVNVTDIAEWDLIEVRNERR